MEAAKRGTPRYRKVGGDSNVDESLFISKDKKKSMGGSSNNALPPVPSNSIVISRNELEKIKVASIVKTQAQIVAERDNAERLKEEKEKKARERKERMIALEEQAKKHTKKSDSELEEEARAEAIRKNAEEKLSSNADLTRLLNTLSSRAAAFTIRDQQIEDKRRLEEQNREYEKQMDLIMELDRLKELKRREEEESLRRQKRIDAKKVIVEQIDDRHRAKLIAAEAREQENQMMRNLMKKYEDEDRIAASKRHVEIERSKIEVMAANDEAIQKKKEEKLREKMEMDEILRYQALKAEEAAKREEEERLLDRQKKERQAKLLAQQEKSQNKLAEIDELRARRAAEAREREARTKEKQAAEKKHIVMEKLLTDRSKQEQSKKEKEAMDRQQEEQQFQKTLELAKQQELAEKREIEKKKEAAREHRSQVQGQIAESERARKTERTAKFEEGAKLREEEAKSVAKLTMMKEKIIKDLENKGVDPAYLAEVKMAKIDMR